MKIAVNKCYGGFAVSKAVYDELGFKWDKYGYLRNEDFGIESDDHYKFRSDARLIAAVEKVGRKQSSGMLAEIYIVDIPDDIEFEIDDYDGFETVRESHRTW